MISIIVPFWNVDKYIETTIKSILNQTYTDYEIIMVDDGSTDNSGKICDEYAKKDNRFKVFHCEHQGVSITRNKGLSKVSGDYIFFLDGDDTIPEYCLETMIKTLTENDADMVMGDLNYINDNGIKDKTLKKLRKNSPIKNETFSGLDFIYKLTLPNSQFYCISCNKLFKKELFDGIEYPENMINEDEATIHKIAFKCKKIVSIKQPLYNYVKHPQTITTKKYTKQNLDRDRAFLSRVNFLKDNGLDDLCRKTALYALKNAPFTIQKCFKNNIYDEVKDELLSAYRYEYSLCKDEKIPLNRLPFKIVLYLIINKPDTYIKYLRLKSKIIK